MMKNILESWMDDNGITERSLRRGVRGDNVPRRGVPRRADFVEKCFWVIFLSAFLVFIGYHIIQPVIKPETNETKEATETTKENDLVNAKLPLEFVDRTVSNMLVGEVGFISPNKIEVSPNRDIWVRSDASVYQFCVGYSVVKVEKFDSYVHLTFYRDRIKMNSEDFSFKPRKKEFFSPGRFDEIIPLELVKTLTIEEKYEP
jgi:hypothetical protein